MTIRFKILAGCLGLTLITCLLGLYERSVERQLGILSVALYDNAFQAMSYLRAAQNDLLVASALPRQRATLRLNDALSNIAIAEQRAMSLDGHSASTGLRALLLQLQSDPDDDRIDDFKAAQDAFDIAVEIYAADGYHLRRLAGDVLVQTARLTWVIIGVALVVALVIIVLLTRSILPPLRKAVGIAQSIAAGRLDNPIEPHGRSETAQLLRALASMQEAIAASVDENHALMQKQVDGQVILGRHRIALDAVRTCFAGSVGGVFKMVSDASVEMAGTASGLLADADALMGSHRDVLGQIEQVVARIGSASHSSQALSEAIVGIRTETGLTERRARATLEETAAATARMQGLSRAADEIVSVADMIGALAAQTKLLALNASIEAARAGEAGLGFAVVATEVKRLAVRSAEAAQIVGRRIASVVEAAHGTRASIDAIALSTQDVHRHSASIVQAVAAQDTASAAMWTNISDILANATNVRQSLETIGTLTRTGAGNLRLIGGEAQTLSQNAVDLSQDVTALMAFVSSVKPGELADRRLVRTAAVMTVDGVEQAGNAIFSSEVAVRFVPALTAAAGAKGLLILTEAGYTLAVRVGQTEREATHLLPSLSGADRARLHAVLEGLMRRVDGGSPGFVMAEAAD